MKLRISKLCPRYLTNRTWSEPDKSNPNSQKLKLILNFQFRGIFFTVYLTILSATESILHEL